MDSSIIIALIIGFGSIVFGFILEGGHLAALIGPSAALIVFGGTIGAVCVSFPGHQTKKFFKIMGIAFKQRKSNIIDKILYFRELSVITRKHGLLSIESELSKDTVLDSFSKKALQMVVDGSDPELIRSTFDLKLEMIDGRHRENAAMFDAAGGYSPTMGIIGTVTGLIHVLGNMSDPSSLAAKISIAFIATLYGVASANLLWLPIANKLKVLNSEEITELQMELEAILLIQEGANPNAVASKLQSFLTEEEIKKINFVKTE